MAAHDGLLLSRGGLLFISRLFTKLTLDATPARNKAFFVSQVHETSFIAKVIPTQGGGSPSKEKSDAIASGGSR